MIAAYVGLFFAAMAAGAILPVPSEAAFVAVLLTSDNPTWVAVAVATVGNVIGSVINWLIGLGIERLRHKPWFPFSQASLARAEIWYHHYGRWSLLFSFVPIIGDPLTVVAGIMRERFWPFLLLVGIAKLGRYVVVAAITLGIV